MTPFDKAMRDYVAAVVFNASNATIEERAAKLEEAIRSYWEPVWEPVPSKDLLERGP